METKQKRNSGGGNPIAYQNGLGKYIKNITLKDEDVFVENSTYARHHIKRRIIQKRLVKYECTECGNIGEWNNKPLPLILDHINGVNDDNRIENLRFVCSNCDSQLPTYKNRRGSKGK
jgi:5-methylcytosine-specific restriction endonuclease McrA